MIRASAIPWLDETPVADLRVCVSLHRKKNLIALTFLGLVAIFLAGCAAETTTTTTQTREHTRPLGQRLVVTAGCGRAQCWGGPIEEIRPGDVVLFAPNEKHWHGAAPTTSMTHIAIQEQLDDGKVVEWMEHVSEEQYGK